MKIIFIIMILISLVQCKSNYEYEEWDSGAQRQKIMREEARDETDEAARDQFPENRPGPNQDPAL